MHKHENQSGASGLVSLGKRPLILSFRYTSQSAGGAARPKKAGRDPRDPKDPTLDGQRQRCGSYAVECSSGSSIRLVHAAETSQLGEETLCLEKAKAQRFPRGIPRTVGISSR